MTTDDKVRKVIEAAFELDQMDLTDELSAHLTHAVHDGTRPAELFREIVAQQHDRSVKWYEKRLQ